MTPPQGLRPPRLDHTIAALGYGSRREAAALVASGRVTSASGLPLLNPALRIPPAEILLDGEPLDHPGPLIILLHKPPGTVCSWNPAEGPSVFDLLPPRWRQRNPRLSTVGRLDRDTTGALLIADDGGLVHRLASPKGGLEKVYLVTLDSAPPPDTAARFASGEFLLPGERKPCLPARLTPADPGAAAAHPRVRLVLSEGRFHQVKRMFDAVGCRVLALHRERFGPWSADDLAPGAWRVLDPRDFPAHATSAGPGLTRPAQRPSFSA